MRDITEIVAAEARDYERYLSQSFAGAAASVAGKLTQFDQDAAKALRRARNKRAIRALHGAAQSRTT